VSEPQGLLSLVTLGVADLKRSIAFYETLGFHRKAAAAEGVGFFQAGECAALAWNCRSLQRPLSDLDGHLWEVAYNPHFPLSDDGRLQLPG
jgi:uncharacterized protein